MQLTDLFLDELEREGPLTRRVLERVPEGRNEWRPHENRCRSGACGARRRHAVLAGHDDRQGRIRPESAGRVVGILSNKLPDNADLLKTMDDGVSAARPSSGNKRRSPLTLWRLLVSGKTVAEHPRAS
jgi:hypothetical protein